MAKANKHIGTSLDSLLKQDGTYDAITKAAKKRVKKLSKASSKTHTAKGKKKRKARVIASMVIPVSGPIRTSIGTNDATLRDGHTAAQVAARAAAKASGGFVAADERVHHPKHYNKHPSGIECITIVRHHNFNVGNVIKYLWRAGLKIDDMRDPVADLVVDLEKAKFYIEDEIERVKQEQKDAALLKSEQAAHADTSSDVRKDIGDFWNDALKQQATRLAESAVKALERQGGKRIGRKRAKNK